MSIAFHTDTMLSRIYLSNAPKGYEEKTESIAYHKSIKRRNTTNIKL